VSPHVEGEARKCRTHTMSQSTERSSAMVGCGTEPAALKPAVALSTRPEKGVPSTLATCRLNDGGVVVVFSMWRTRRRLGWAASYGDQDGRVNQPIEKAETRRRKTARRAVKKAPQRWHSGDSCTERRERVSSSWAAGPGRRGEGAHHGDGQVADCADQARNDEVDGRLGAETTGERYEEVEEADDALDADEER